MRLFLGLPLSKNPPDHSTLSRTRRLLDLETHHRVLSWVLAVVAKADLVRGKTVGVDSTTLEANTAMGYHSNDVLTGLDESESRAYIAEPERGRRLHIRRHDNILERVLVQAAGANLGLLTRTLFGVGTPRDLQGRRGLIGALARALPAAVAALLILCHWQRQLLDSIIDARRTVPGPRSDHPPVLGAPRLRCEPGFTTGC